MKKNYELWTPFLTKEKMLLISIIVILINVCLYIVYKGSIYSYDGFLESYPNGSLEFYYHFHCIGLNPFLFFLMMLLMSNLVSYDFLNIHQNHVSYLIETRLGKKEYYRQCFIKNIIFSILITLLIEIMIILVIHFFYGPIQFNQVSYPDNYYCMTQILSSNECLSLIFFIILTALGYGLVSSLLFSLQVIISNKYIFRCFGVIFGVLLILVPALIQGYLPIPEAAFILQINNVVALGMENVRENAFHLPHIGMYGFCFLIYSIISYYCYQFLLKWRSQYD